MDRSAKSFVALGAICLGLTIFWTLWDTDDAYSLEDQPKSAFAPASFPLLYGLGEEKSEPTWPEPKLQSETL